MRKLTSLLLAGMLLATSLPAAADSFRGHDRRFGDDRHYRQRHLDHYRHGNPWVWGAAGLTLGGLLWSIDASPPVVVQPVRPPGQVWYWCQSSQGYYPHVPYCPEGWRAVPAY